MAKTSARIILIKDAENFDDALDSTDDLESKYFPENQAKLFWKQSSEHTPKWVKNIFPENSDLHEAINSRTVSALLLIKHSGYLFGVTFGYGRGLVKQELIEPQFGLKIVLNRVNAANLRSIDTKSLDGFLSQTREQVPVLSPMSNFGIDIEKDFIKAVTGSSNDSIIGKTITGTDSFYASLEIDLDNLPTIFDRLLEAYNDVAYKENFEFVDNIMEVPKSLVDKLDTQLVASIKAGSNSRIWLAPPEIIDWNNHGGFGFKRSRKGEIYDDINLSLYLNEKIPVLNDLSIQNLKAHQVMQLTAEYRFESMKWSVYNCLYAELENDNKRYILSDGKWFEVDQAYVSRVQQYLKQNLDEWSGPTLPDYESGRMAILDENGRRGEALYNYEASNTLGYTLMDRKMIVHGGANSQIELCDLYDENLYIHVKRYTRSSGLSHLFNQGKVSAELVCSDKDFRTKAKARVRAEGGLCDLTSSRPDMSEIHVVFGVVSGSKGKLELPFFSQVALKNTLYFLKNTLDVGKVSLVKIDASDEIES